MGDVQRRGVNGRFEFEPVRRSEDLIGHHGTLRPFDRRGDKVVIALMRLDEGLADSVGNHVRRATCRTGQRGTGLGVVVAFRHAAEHRSTVIRAAKGQNDRISRRQRSEDDGEKNDDAMTDRQSHGTGKIRRRESKCCVGSVKKCVIRGFAQASSSLPESNVCSSSPMSAAFSG